MIVEEYFYMTTNGYVMKREYKKVKIKSVKSVMKKE